MKIGFDNEKYLKIQSEHIKERIDQFGDKLYLEFGGKKINIRKSSRISSRAQNQYCLAIFNAQEFNSRNEKVFYFGNFHNMHVAMRDSLVRGAAEIRQLDNRRQSAHRSRRGDYPI